MKVPTIPQKNSHKPSEGDVTTKSHSADSIKREMRGAIEDAAGPRAAGETKERWIERAGYALGLTYSRAYEIWHLRARRIDAYEYLNVRERLRAHAAKRISTLRAEIARLEVTVAQKADPRLEPNAGSVLAGREQGRR